MAYISMAVGDGRAMVNDILEVSRRNNAAHNITGSLFYDGVNFTQFLEGSLLDIEALFEVIKKDPRHAQIIQLHKIPITKRRFGYWSMHYGHEAA